MKKARAPTDVMVWSGAYVSDVLTSGGETFIVKTGKHVLRTNAVMTGGGN